MTSAVTLTLLALKQLLRSPFYLVLVVVQPLFFVVVTALLSDGRRSAVVGSVAGATVMGMWSATLFGAGRALQRERRQGTTELLLVAPASLLRPVFCTSTAAALLGVVSAVSGLATAYSLFGIATGWRSGAAFILMVFVGVGAMSCLGVLLSAMFVLLRQASVLSNMLEYPLWFACALIIPADARPALVAAVGEVLVPTHLGSLLREAVLADGSVSGPAVVKLVGLSVLYVVGAIPLFRRVDDLARRRGDLSTV